MFLVVESSFIFNNVYIIYLAAGIEFQEGLRRAPPFPLCQACFLFFSPLIASSSSLTLSLPRVSIR
jgi:hypothetical protein